MEPPAPADEISAVRVYRKTLSGILITFLVCNALIIAATALGFAYTIRRIDQTYRSVNDKIDASYAELREFSRKQSLKVDQMTDELKVANKAFFDAVGVTVEDYKKNRPELYQKLREGGQDLLFRYLRERTAKPATEGTEAAPATQQEAKP